MSKKELKHNCDQNRYPDVDIRFEKINQAEWSWVLAQWQMATKFDIEDGYKGELGSMMCSHFLLITHCPFCGENLVARAANTW